MKKANLTTSGHAQDIQREVDRRYKLSGFKPNGFEDDMWGEKFGILSEMYEQEEELGIAEERVIAYAQVAELYRTMGGWF